MPLLWLLAGFKRKGPGIPNSFPFKTEMLQGIQRQKEQAIAEKARKKQVEREGRKCMLLESAEENNKTDDDASELQDLR